MENETVLVLIKHGICELAVPFFVVTTAFFFYRKIVNCGDGNVNLVFVNYIKHLAILLLSWSVIYLPVYFYKECFVAKKSFSAVMIQYLEKFLLKGETYLHLWYIQALIVSSVIIFYLSQKISTEKLLAVSYILYIGYQFFENCELGELTRIYSLIPVAILNYTCRISVFILIGKLFAEQKKKRDNKVNIIGLIVASVAGVAFLILRLFHESIGASLQFLVLPIIIYFLFAICIGIDFSFNRQSEVRKMTELFYFTHLLIPLELYDLIFYPILKEAEYNFFVIMIFYIAFSIIVSLIILKASKHKKLKFLKYLY